MTPLPPARSLLVNDRPSSSSTVSRLPAGPVRVGCRARECECEGRTALIQAVEYLAQCNVLYGEPLQEFTLAERAVSFDQRRDLDVARHASYPAGEDIVGDAGDVRRHITHAPTPGGKGSEPVTARRSTSGHGR
jgi:hypothetical protein